MRIIPAIDLMDGKCVRLVKGDFDAKTIYGDDPVMIAQQFEQLGFESLHLVDLDGAKSGKIQNGQVLKNISQKTKLKIDFSGGLSDTSLVETAFENGAQQVTIGSVAIKDPELLFRWLEEFGIEKVILAVDVLEEKIMVRGWLEETQVNLFEFLNKMNVVHLKYVMCTDISKDGMLKGPSMDLYKKILERHNFQLIASGGISSVRDVFELNKIGCSAAIIGKALYEGHIQIDKLQKLC